MSGKTFLLILHLFTSGDEYVIDQGMTYDDCIAIVETIETPSSQELFCEVTYHA